MNIAFLTNNINQIGGIERVINILGNYFTENLGYNIEIISLYSQEYNNIFKFSDNIKFYHANLYNHSCINIKDRLLNRKIMIKEVYNILKNRDYDIIMTFHPPIADYVISNKNKIKGKIIATEHCSHNFEGKLRQFINRKIFKKADKFIVLTESDKEYYKTYIKGVDNIPNAVPFRSDIVSSCDNKRIIAVGRLEEVKGFDYLIDAFNLIHKKHNGWKLDIIGDGTQRKLLEEKIKMYNLEDKINILHFTENIKEELINSSIYASTSKNEGFGLVLVEAMECGLPIVSFDIPSAKEILSQNENSLLANSYDIHDFAKKLSILIKDDEKRKQYGIKSKINVKKYYIENIAEKWDCLFKGITQKYIREE